MDTQLDKILWGDNLRKAVEEARPSREFLIEGFLYKKSTQMIYAPDGAGKSLITLQSTIQGTIDKNKVFGEYYVENGFKTFYIQAERDVAENLERIKAMKEATPFDYNKFVLDTSLQGINLRNERHFEKGVEHIKQIVESSIKTVDLIVLDPIYAMVRGGLKDDESASYVTEFSRILQKHFGCSMLLVHHANRGQRDKDTGERRGEDMFGSRFLSAHCTGVYRLTLKADGIGSILNREKNSNENLDKRIELIYDHESGLSWVGKSKNDISKTDKLYNFLKTCKSQDRYFSFNDMMESSGVSKSFLRGQLSGHLKNSLKIVHKTSTGAILYHFIG